MSRFIINSVPFETRLCHDAKQILARDQARAKKFLAGLQPHGPAAFLNKKTRKGGNTADGIRESIDVTDTGVAYTIPVSDIYYGSGTFTGTEYIDQVTLGGNLIAKEQSIGVASSVRGFNLLNTFCGSIGPVNLSTGTDVASPVTENLFNSGIIPSISIGMSYFPNAADIANGEITFGATDTAKYTPLRACAYPNLTSSCYPYVRFTGSVNYVPMTTIEPADKYWGIDEDLTYGEDIELLRSSAGIVDIGTTFLLIASDAFKVYRRATGAEEDPATGLLTVTEDQFKSMESLFFTIGTETYDLIPNAQIWPRELNETIGGEKGKIYLIVADMGSSSGAGLDFINGFAFLQRFYSVFDTTNRRFGLARTKFTTKEIN
ncbi:hypothetical protein C0991_004966 [Blastosporella zonata]|nr:hypothetical protein C0991_004966 [Blastosporella zonata]